MALQQGVDSFLSDLSRMLVHARDSGLGERWYTDGDATQGFWLMQDRVEGAGLIRVRHEIDFAEKTTAALRKLTVDIDTTRLESESYDRRGGTRSRVLLATYPGNWSAPELFGADGSRLAPCARNELLPDLAAAALELVTLAKPPDSTIGGHEASGTQRPPEFQLLRGCARRVIDSAALQFEESRGLRDITEERALEVSRDGSAVGRCLRWVLDARAELQAGRGMQIDPILTDLGHVGMVALPSESIDGRHRLTIDFGSVPLTQERHAPGLRGSIRAWATEQHLTRDIEIPLPDMAPALESTVAVRAPEGLEFAPSLLVRTSRKLAPASGYSPLATAATALGPLLEIRWREVRERYKDMHRWVDQVLDRDVPLVLEVEELDQWSKVNAEPLAPLERFRSRLTARLAAVDQVAPGEAGAAEVLRDMETEVERTLDEARALGFRATFFPDTAPEAEMFVARLPAREHTDTALKLDLRFLARLRPSDRTYTWSIGALLASATLTFSVLAYLLGPAEVSDVSNRIEALVTILVIVPASLLGAVLSTTRSGLTRHLLRYWLNLVAVFAFLVPVALAVLLATVTDIPTWVLEGVLLMEFVGLLLAGRAALGRWVHRSQLPRSPRLMAAIQRILLLPHPLEVMTQALRWESSTK